LSRTRFGKTKQRLGWRTAARAGEIVFARMFFFKFAPAILIMYKWLACAIMFMIIACKKNEVTYTPKTYPAYSNATIHKIFGYRLFTVNGELSDQSLITKYAAEFSNYFYTPSSPFNDINIKRVALVTEDSLWNLGTNPVGEMKRKSTGEYDKYESSQWFTVNDTNNILAHLMKYKVFEKQQTPSGFWYLKIPSPFNVLKRSGDTLIFPVTRLIIFSRNTNYISFASDKFNNDLDPAGSKKLGTADTLLVQRLDVALYKEK
jgi:hypothetical protein